MIGRKVYVKLELIDLEEVNKVLPRASSMMIMDADEGQNPRQTQRIEFPGIVLFQEVAQFKRIEYLAGTVMSYKPAKDSYNDPEYIVRLEADKLETDGRLILTNRVYEAEEYDQPEQG